MLLRNQRVSTVCCVCGYGSEPLAQSVREFCLKTSRSHPGLCTPQKIEPVGISLFEEGGLAFEYGLGIQRNPERWGVGHDAVAEESRGRNADDGDGMALHKERRAD